MLSSKSSVSSLNKKDKDHDYIGLQEIKWQTSLLTDSGLKKMTE
jgi:hypothetical protein